MGLNKQEIHICGLDEAGRGALAGPLVIAAVVLKEHFNFNLVTNKKIRDSKTLSPTQRAQALEVIKEHSLQTEIEVISVDEINRYGIQWANIEGFKRLVNKITADKYIIDGRWNKKNFPVKTGLIDCVIDADAIHPSTIAAGIVAKCSRDEIMHKEALVYPQYGWTKNAGYGTLLHRQALIKTGTSPVHRTKFVDTVLEKFKLVY